MLNEFYANIGTKDFIKRYGVVNALKRGLFTKMKLHMVYDYEMRKVLWQFSVAKDLKKYILSNKNYIEEIKFDNSFNVNNPIWIYWNSGIESAPEIVRCCYKSVESNIPDNIITLNEENIGRYVKLPKWIGKKLRSEKLPIAHYTDILRLALLYNFGGTWIDATVFLTRPLPDMVMNSDFFALRNSLCLLDNPALYAVWLIHAKPRNVVIEKTLNASLAYWNKENHVKEYLMTNIIMTTVIHQQNLDKKIPYYNTDYSEYLMRILGDNFSENNFKWIKSLTCIHKLSYKLDEKIKKPDTYYNYIVKKYHDN